MPLHPDQVKLGELSVRQLWTCPPSINIGDPVYQNGPDSVALADCTASATMPAEGIVDEKPTPTSCYVVSHGKVQITGWGLTTDVDYYVGVGIVDVAANLPTIPGTNIQQIGRSKNSNELLVDIRVDVFVL